eukprot:TRINITY_DN4562_c0_g2_i4.p1 TRINITY_DN4562_c0_g2~~TRINITY_DN4562_c0_g2_i4.p1  ORF type:complete len:781 (-),score=150.22 TRINITY_DN4562_c0_g2_i4:939-3281(-)
MSQVEQSAVVGNEFAHFKERVGDEKVVPYEKLMKLFTGKYEQGFHERQIAAIAKIVKKNQDGVPVGDLVHIEPLVRFVFAKIHTEGLHIFIQPLCNIIRLFTNPMKKALASEEFKSITTIGSFLQLLGNILSCEHDELVLCANQVIASFAQETQKQHIPSSTPTKENRAKPSSESKVGSSQSHLPAIKASSTSIAISQSQSPLKKPLSEHEQDRSYLHHQYFPAIYNNQIIDSSGVIPLIVAALKVHENNPNVALDLLETIRSLSQRKANAAQFASTSLVVVLIRFMERNFQDASVSMTIEIVWNLFDHHHPIRLDFGSKGGIAALKSLFVRCLSDGYRVKDKELRNDVLVLSTLVAQTPSQRQGFLESGFIENILQVCVGGELQRTFEAVKPFALTNSKEDFEMKRLVLFLIQLLCGNEECLEFISSYDVMAVLLMYINHAASNMPHINKYSRPQLQMLQLHALTILDCLIAHSPETYQRLDGNHLLLTYIMEHSNDEFRVPAMRLLLHTCHHFRAELGSEGAVYMMLTLFKDHSNSETVRTHAVSIISKLCEGSEQNQNFFGKEGGVNTILAYMNYHPESALRLQDTFITCVVDCVWNAVVGHKRNEARFITQQGIDAIFDMLENSPDYLKSILLGCLTDLLKNSQCLEVVHGWKSSKTHMGFAELLVDLWVKEDGKQLEIEAAAGDPSKKKEHEYMKAINSEPGVLETRPSLPSEVIETASTIDIRVKIYSLLHVIGFDKFDYVQRSYKVKLDLVLILSGGLMWISFPFVIILPCCH